MYCRVLIKTEEPQLKTSSHRSQSTPDTLETQNFSTPSPSSLYHHQSVLSVMCETNVRHVHCIELYRAITGQKKIKDQIKSEWSVSLGDYTLVHITEAHYLGGQRGMTGVEKSPDRLMRLPSSSRTPALGPSQII